MELDARIPGKTASYLGEYQRKLSLLERFWQFPHPCLAVEV